jgi:hypothetical protein
MSGWNSHERSQSRRNACKGLYSPQKYTVRIDDSHAQWRYRIAAAAFGMQVPSFFVFCTEYVIRHRRELKETRRMFREVEAERGKRKKREAREQRAGRHLKHG